MMGGPNSSSPSPSSSGLENPSYKIIKDNRYPDDLGLEIINLGPKFF